MRRLAGLSLLAVLGCASAVPTGTPASTAPAPEVWVTRAAVRGEIPGLPEVWIPRENLAGPRPPTKPLR